MSFAHLETASYGYFENLDGDDIFAMLSPEQQAKISALPVATQECAIGHLIFRLHKTLANTMLKKEARIIEEYQMWELTDESVDEQIGYAVRDCKA